MTDAAVIEAHLACPGCGAYRAQTRATVRVPGHMPGRDALAGGDLALLAVFRDRPAT
ncbi:hypothetical protein GCM10010472_21050 [Pseudonocardia halophobica]|uniref:Uncharacterized protein n=1 Tax=Pseudonocardia halophobica TaxID=29401 RepID=A0A9W6KY02_9PSEU|nr:hypothetical protein GCM10017577_04770 [Pseudonocardia halophobica]